MKTFLVLVMMTFAFLPVHGQHQEIFEKPEMYKGKMVQLEDSTSILSAFRRGQVNGHFRYFFMSTQNQPGLTDYYANAAGGGLRFETARFHGFQFGVSGFYTFNIGSSDLGKPDPQTGLANRYEIALFDVEDPYNKKDNDRLEELFLKYSYRNSSLVFGKQLLNSPFINLQDGRMRPTGVEGIWFEINELKKAKLEGGYLYAISPRATTKWFSVAESIGIFPVGVGADGNKSSYHGNLESKGIFMLGTHIELDPKLNLHAWNVFVQNIFNTALVQLDLNIPGKNKGEFFASAQMIRQDAVKDGGNPDPEKAFMKKGNLAFTFGARTGWKNDKWETSLNYNRITDNGRYLMPREWGREPFFTYLPRERNEGYGDALAVLAKASYQVASKRIKYSLGIGYYKLPDVTDFQQNKYGLPSYTQANGEVRYSFNRLLQGLEAQLLVAGKLKAGNSYENKKYEFNKVKMVNYSVVFNYHF